MINSKSYLEDRRLSQSQVDAALQCLIDNGIDKDESGIVLQALCYILMDEEIEEMLPNDCPEGYKCDQYVRDYPFYHCGHSAYEQACGYWCNYKNEWVDTMAGYTGLCDDCKFNRYKQIIKD